MLSAILFTLLGAAIAQDCSTITSEVLIPTTTYTFLSTRVITEQANTPQNLGTWTEIVQVRTTRYVKTMTSTITDCIANTTFTSPPTSTVYTNALAKRDCTVTVNSTTTYGATYSWIPANKTSTYTRYTDFTMKTVSRTTTGGTSYTIGTAYTTTCKACGPTVTAGPPVTISNDARCAPTAIVSAAGQYNGSAGFGILYLNDNPLGGATYRHSSPDASTCCQICVNEEGCAASAWDIRTNECRLLFSVQWDTGSLSCANGALAFYNYGPNRPMQPGTGWYLAKGCGWFQTAGAKPDDGS